ncbi:MAG: DUF4054 domain-containing protein [Synergistaceae bacterium]|jgi:hypothetical protein|nr:DUF4054 domain-containing protein [Synergistaceae bacterium]
MADTLQIYRVVAPEFGAVDDATVGVWLDLTAPLVSRKRFGEVYGQALALLAAHRMKTAGVGLESGTGRSELNDIGGVGAAFKLASYSSGGESISFNGGALTSKLDTDAEYAQTVYGAQYLTLRNLYTIPILNSAEREC